MPKSKSENIYTPREGFAANYDGVDRSFSPGDLFSEDHEMVRIHPDLFVLANVERPAVEQATKAPGEKR